MRPANTIVILSDEHNRDVLSCYGDAIAKTPHLDALAARGVRFANAYCNSPVCVPSRASLATGRYPHEIGTWDSTMAYTGTPQGWAGHLRDQGHEVVSIGKLHFRRAEDDCGFSESRLPMHIHDGTGWLSSLLREPPVQLETSAKMAQQIGAGETGYTAYDRATTAEACAWIRQAGARTHDKPWVLYVGLVAPHFPLIAPQEFFDLYNGIEFPMPRQYAEHERPRHPVVEGIRKYTNYDAAFDSERLRVAQQSYYGLVSFLDHNIGQILEALNDSGQAEQTRVIYASDHGENLGHRGLWGKSVMYDDSAAVPMLAAGPDLPSGLVVESPVSLVDCAPTLTEWAGAAPMDAVLPGDSLTERLSDPSADRAVFSEYHDWSSITGMFMLRTRDWKIVRYPGHDDQLFDMRTDPHEQNDLALDPEFSEVLSDMRMRLAKVLDVDAVNSAAFSAQRAKIAALGGAATILDSEDNGYTPAPSLAANETKTAGS